MMLTDAAIIGHRMHNQQLVSSRFSKPEDLVRWLVAMQAQEYAFAKWAVAVRLKGEADEELVEKAFNKGTILRTHLMRPTWHFVHPADIRWLLQVTAPQVHQLNAYMYRQTGLDKPLLKKAGRVLTDALKDGKHLMRKELQQALLRKKIIAEGVRLAYIVMYAELEGIICSGARNGKQFTYALLEERVPPVKPLHRKEALAQFAARYFASRGPASVKDFAYWSGLGITQAREAAASLPSSFIREKFKNEEYIISETSVGSLSRTTFLMPIYDEYGMSYKNRDVLMAPGMNGKLATAFNNFIVTNGVITGGWKPGIDRQLEMESFISSVKTSARETQKAIKKYMAFRGEG